VTAPAVPERRKSPAVTIQRRRRMRSPDYA
jgi:hypothetical protein